MSEDQSYQYLREYSEKDKIWDTQKRISNNVEKTLYSFQNAVLSAERHDQQSISLLNSVFSETPSREKLKELGSLALKKGLLMSDCGKNLIFALNTTDDGELVHRLFRAEFCKFRYCPVCNWRKSLKLKALFLARAESIVENNKSISYLFLTLTMKNDSVEVIDEMLEKLNSSFRKITKQKFFKSSVKGTVKTIEITRSNNGEAHPHLHVILAVSSNYFKPGNYKKTEQWAEIWKKALAVDYTPIVDIRRVYGKTEKGERSEKLTSVVAEALKYAVKGTDLRDLKFLIHLTDKTKGKRFISATGIFQGVFKEDFSDDELIQIEDDEQADKKPDDIRAYSFNTGFRKYIRDFILEESEKLRMEQESAFGG